MRLMEKMLYAITAHLPCRLIKGNHGEPYLERYLLLRAGDYRCYLHRFVDSDPDDRGIHDHPWRRSASWLLTGDYREMRMLRRGDPDSVVWRHIRRGRWNVIRGEDFHRVALIEGRPVWTLFIHGKKVKRWGFLGEISPGRFGPLDSHYVLDPERPFNERAWWETAPKGREAPRLPADWTPESAA